MATTKRTPAKRTLPTRRSKSPVTSSRNTMFKRVLANIQAGAPPQEAHKGVCTRDQLEELLLSDEEKRQSFESVELEVMKGLLTDLKNASDSTWRKYAWMLERRFPHAFSEKAQVDVKTSVKLEVDEGTCAVIAASFKAFEERHREGSVTIDLSQLPDNDSETVGKAPKILDNKSNTTSDNHSSSSCPREGAGGGGPPGGDS